MPHNLTLFFWLLGGLVLYVAVGMTILAIWVRRRKARWPASIRTSPNGSIVFLAPLLIYIEAYSLGSMVVAIPLLLVALPEIQPSIALAAAAVVALIWALICVSVNRALLKRMRALERRNSAFHTL